MLVPEACSSTAQASPSSFQTNPGNGDDDLVLKSGCVLAHLLASLTQDRGGITTAISYVEQFNCQQININYFLIMIRRAQTSYRRGLGLCRRKTVKYGLHLQLYSTKG